MATAPPHPSSRKSCGFLFVQLRLSLLLTDLMVKGCPRVSPRPQVSPTLASACSLCASLWGRWGPVWPLQNSPKPDSDLESSPATCVHNEWRVSLSSPGRHPSPGPLTLASAWGGGRGERPAQGLGGAPPPSQTVVTLWVGVRAVLTAAGSSGLGYTRCRPPPKWFSCCLLFGYPALGISYTAPHPSRHRAVCPSFEGGLRKVPWVSLGWATPSPAHQPGPVSLRLPKGAGRRNSCRQAGWAAPSRSSVPQLWHLQAPGQWPPSGDETLRLEAVTWPAVSRLQSGGGALSILLEPRGGAGRVGLQACSRPNNLGAWVSDSYAFFLPGPL